MKNTCFQGPREFAKRGIKSEREIRRDIAAGKVPGFWAGNRFRIDAEAYICNIRAECKSNSERGNSAYEAM